MRAYYIRPNIIGMTDLAETLKRARADNGISQGELASLSGVSLATIQNIESRRANPAWSTLVALMKALNLSLEIYGNAIDWDTLSALGCPLLDKDPRPREWLASRMLLLQSLRALNLPLAGVKRDSREGRALSAWFSALRDHYPSIWESTPAAVKNFILNEASSLKLRRLALQKLGEYL